jgi:glucosyl-3-phosphoglycerate synthase
VAQVDLGINYEHKHQAMSVEDGTHGLHRMVLDISRFFFHYLRSNGVPLDRSFIEMISQTYYGDALKVIKSYSDDAEINGLRFDRYQEELTVRYFRQFLVEAWEELKGTEGEAQIPSWNRVFYSVRDIYPRINEAVERDNSRQ